MSRSTGGRILIFSFIMPACLFVCSLGFGLHALRVDRKLIFIRYFLQPTFGLIIAGYAGVTLSVSIFWLQVVEKAQRMSSGNKQTFACSYLGALVSVLSCVGILLVLVVLSWIYVRSNSMFPVLGALLQLMVSSFYRIARQRIKLVCDVMLLTISERIANGGNIPDIALHKVKEIAERVQDFASTMSWNFALLCTFFFIDGFHASSSETALRSSERTTTIFVRANSRRLGVFKMNSFSNSLYI
jgi:drug/metabolite transporter superfamily protein YnfA